ncbi:hypothetical protein [Mesorhizobium sp.]|uniref:hypothetical protein n=1 Tax=Mesorhizobium sp. TaxID=1871066 RepID=UPI000FE5407B|nr:hypothetical protein [Mesorhizobium sp.]RWP51355.1 MAG: hypothetical protein EOR06_22405 [Mesorhizobium sp.]
MGPFNERHFEYLGVEEPECNPNENQPYQSGFRFIESAESDLVGLIDNGKYFPIALVTSENSIWVAAGRTCKGPVANNGSGDYTISLINTISLLEDLDVAVCVQVDVKAGAAADYEFTSICNIYKNRNGDLLQALAIKDANVHLLNLTENFGGQDVLPGDDFRVELVIQLSTRTTTLGAWFPVWVSASLGVAEQQG